MTRQPEQRNNPAGDRVVSRVNVDDGDLPKSVGQTVDQFAKRLLQECLAAETRTYWLRRAETFAAVGTDACDEIAQACRNRAALAPFDDFREVVAQVLREVA